MKINRKKIVLGLRIIILGQLAFASTLLSSQSITTKIQLALWWKIL